MFQANQEKITLLFQKSDEQKVKKIANIFKLNKKIYDIIEVKQSALYALYNYLKLIFNDVEIKINNHPFLCLFSSSLEIEGYGSIECIVVPSDNDKVYIAPEITHNRNFYVFASVSMETRKAEICGFMPSKLIQEFSNEENEIFINLKNLLPISDLLKHLEIQKYIARQNNISVINLGKWFDGIFEDIWKTLDAVLSQPRLAYRNRTVQDDKIERAKVLSFKETEEEVIFCLQLKQINETQIKVWIDLYPKEDKEFLPLGLKLIILNQDKNKEKEEEINKEYESITIPFTVKFEENFSIGIGFTEITEMEFESYTIEKKS